ncbi:MAG: biopolymer transporter ExbD [Puniceicoccales bacterium]|jgi:biopolymer transport protein ExbD|nr:biopolymer transporter ExbD [Puniceicoccales bacterium]
MKRISSERTGDLGFQIAPMIDVVFVIMLFFMVMAGQVTREQSLRIKLPGEEQATDAPLEMPDELTIALSENGQVSINDNNVDTPASNELPQLYGEVRKLAENARMAKTKLLVTVQSDERTPYKKIALVLDTLAWAGANENVTFSIGADEE